MKNAYNTIENKTTKNQPYTHPVF